jgi:hypothetical protein
VPDAAVHALCVARTDLRMLRFAQDNVLLKADYSGRRILAAVLFYWFLKYLDDRSVIKPTAKEPAHPKRIGNPAVCRKVKAARRWVVCRQVCPPYFTR